jgi:hypothetical protein
MQLMCLTKRRPVVPGFGCGNMVHIDFLLLEYFKHPPKKYSDMTLILGAARIASFLNLTPCTAPVQQLLWSSSVEVCGANENHQDCTVRSSCSEQLMSLRLCKHRHRRSEKECKDHQYSNSRKHALRCLNSRQPIHS